MAGKVLLIDGDVATAQEISLRLEQEGYRAEHLLPGLHAIRRMLISEPDLVILGIRLPEEGWQFCRRLLTFLDRPLLLLLSTGDRLDRVKGLELGADDCMIKPVLLAEVVARVRALLRRNGSQPLRRTSSFFVDGDLVVDLTRREVRLDDEPVRLTPSEFRILSCLVRHAGEVMSHEQLLAQAWGPTHAGSSNVIKQYIHRLRRKLEPEPRRPQRIVTWRGEGYMLRRLEIER